MSTTVRDPLAGHILDGRYRIVDRIATGGMATVYRSVDIRLERPVAVKILHATWSSDSQARLRFQREARAAAQLSHPDVVAVHDAGEDGDEPFLVMEYVAGGTLRDVIRDRLRVGAGEAVAVMDHVLAALAAAHRIGLVHRDVKPENVLITPDGRVKVADFGLARAVADASITTTTSGLIGTAAYLAPEQWTGGPVDARSDVYAAGVMLFELLTGAPPFAGDPPPVVMRRHLEESVPGPSSYAPGVPPEIDRLVAWATRRDPDERPRDAAELHSALMSAARRDGLMLTVPALPVAVTDRLTAGTRRIEDTAPPVTGAPAATAVAATSRAPAGPDRTAPPRSGGRRRWPWISLLVILLVAAAAVLGWWLAVGRFVNVPNLLGDNRAAAQAQLNKLGLHAHWLRPQFNPQYDKGLVAYESPAPGHGVSRGGTVAIALSRGPRQFAMPAVSGQPRDKALARLRSWDLKVTVRTKYDNNVHRSLAIGTEPQQGVTVNAGDSVTLLISKGHRPVAVPDVTGSDPDTATGQLTADGFAVGTTRQVYDDTVPAGKVVRTNPPAGAVKKYGSTVDLVVSKGPKLFRVPDVTNQPIDKAVQTLREAGFSPQPHQVFPGGPGTVLKENPSGGSMEPHGWTVVLDYF